MSCVNFSYQHCVPCTVLGASTELHLLIVPPKTLGRGYGYCCSVAKSCPTLCNPMDCSTTGFPVLHSLQEFAQIHVHWVGDAIQPSHPLLPLLLLSSVFPSIRVFSHESALQVRWPNYWSFSISPTNEYSGLISFRIDWVDLLAVQGTLKSLLHHHSSKASILQSSAFFIVQLLQLYMTTEKTFVLTIWPFTPPFYRVGNWG